jgi:hypothetical protein
MERGNDPLIPLGLPLPRAACGATGRLVAWRRGRERRVFGSDIAVLLIGLERKIIRFSKGGKSLFA